MSPIPQQRSYSLSKDGAAVDFMVSGRMPANARMHVESVEREDEEGNPMLAAYDITLTDEHNQEWQPAYGQPAQVTITDPGFGNGRKLDIFHETEEGREYVTTVVSVNNTVTFPAKHFSVYVIGTPNGKNRMVVAFVKTRHNDAYPSPDSLLYDTLCMLVKRADTIYNGKFMTRLVYPPNPGYIPDGVNFFGWSRTPDYTADPESRMTIDVVRELVYDRLKNGEEITKDLGDTMMFYSVLLKAHTINYRSLRNPNVVIGVDEVLYLRNDNPEQDYIVNESYIPTAANANFQGWLLIEGDSNVVDTLPDNIYPNGTSIKIKGDITFMEELAYGYWLVFNENGKGASYTAPKFLKSNDVGIAGDTLSEAEPDHPTRYGYNFGGWYADPTFDTPFVFKGYLNQDTIIHAKWVTKERAFYTIIVWRQNVARDGGYDFAESFSLEGDVGYSIKNQAIVTGKEGDLDYVIVDGKKLGGIKWVLNGQESDPYTGFTISSVNPIVDQAVTTDGKAVVNIYFDRMKYKLKLYVVRTNDNGNGGYKGTKTGSSTHPEAPGLGNVPNEYLLGNWESGNIVSLSGIPQLFGSTPHLYDSWDDYRFYYYPLTAYYGENIRDRWPTHNNITVSGSSKYVSWYLMSTAKAFVGGETGTGNGTGGNTLKGEVNILDEQILGRLDDSTANLLLARYATTFCPTTFYYYFHDVNGNPPDEPSDTVITRAGENNYKYLFDKGPSFEGYTYDKNASDGLNYKYHGQNKDSAYVLNYHYRRKAYSITFRDGVYMDGNGDELQNNSSNTPLRIMTGVKYGANIDTLNSYVPTLPLTEEGFVFDGWYMDEACSRRYEFDKMPMGNLVVYARWRQIQYRVFLHPQAGTDPSLNWGNASQAMNFRISYGDKVSAPTGQRDLYEFGGWYLDSTYQNRYFAEVSTLTEQTVTTPYVKNVDMTDNMDKWGVVHNPDTYPYVAYNSDTIVINNNGDIISNKDTVDRFWITKKLDLYARWRHKLDGAEGVKVQYFCDSCEASSMPRPDNNLYLDKSKMVAGPAATSAVHNKIFAYWVLQNWSPTKGRFVDSLDADGKPVFVYPGGPYTLHLPYTWRKQTGDSAVYVYQLRAELESFEDNRTFIVWYRNWGKPDGDTVRYDRPDTPDSLTINMMVSIPSAEEVGPREGYIYKGWHKKGYGPEGSGQESTFEDRLLGDTATVNSIWYNPEDGEYYSKDYSTLDPDSLEFYRAYGVGADEVTPYDYFYAVWEPIKYTVQFDKNTTDPSVTGNMPGQVFKYGEEQDLSKIGYLYQCHKFLGWSLTPNGEVVFENQQAILNLTSKNDSLIHLYAQWVEESHDLVLSPDSASCLSPGSIDIRLDGVSMPNYTYSVIELDTTDTPYGTADTVWQHVSSGTHIVAHHIVHGPYRVEVVTGSQCVVYKDTAVFLNPVEVPWDNPIATVCKGSPFVIKPSSNDDVRYLWDAPTKSPGAVVIPDTANNNDPQEYILCTISNNDGSPVSYTIHAILGNCELGDVPTTINVSTAELGPFTINLSSLTDTLCSGTSLDVTASVNENIYNKDSYILNWIFKGDTISSTETGHSPTVIQQLTMPDTCRGDFSVEVYYADVTECHVNAVKNFKVRIKDWEGPERKDSTVHCVKAAVAPHTIEPSIMPVVKDGCGNTLTPILYNKVVEPVDLSCDGTVTYIYEYEDCDGEEKNWYFVYHVDKQAPKIAITSVPDPTPIDACQYRIPAIGYELTDCDPSLVTVTQTPSATDHIRQIDKDSVVTITLTATDKCGLTATEPVDVTIPARPTVTPTAEKPEFCLGDTTRVTAATTGTSSASVITWTATPSTGEFTYGTDTTFTATTHDPYTLTATVVENGCLATGETSVTVKPSAELTITNQNQTTCFGASISNVYITLLYTDNLVTSGDLPAGVTFHSENNGYVISGTPTQAGVFKYFLTASSQDPSCGVTKDSVSIEISPFTEGTVSITGDTVFCEGKSTTLRVEPNAQSNAKSYTWANSNGILPYTKSYLTVVEPGTYSVTVTSLEGCISTGSQIVTRNPRPSVELLLPSPICPEDNVQPLQANITDEIKKPEYTYYWTTGKDAAFNGTEHSATPTLTMLVPENCATIYYPVTLILEDSSGCQKTVSDSILMRNVPPTISRKTESITLSPNAYCQYFIPNQQALDTLVDISGNCTPTEELSTSIFYPSANDGDIITSTDSITITVTDACNHSARTKIEVKIPEGMPVQERDSLVLNSFEWEGITYTKSTTVESEDNNIGHSCSIDRANITVLYTNRTDTAICEGGTANLIVNVDRPVLPAVGDVLSLKPTSTTNVYDTLVLRPDTFLARATDEELTPIGVVFYVDPNDNSRGKALALVDASSSICQWSNNNNVNDKNDNNNTILDAAYDTAGYSNTINILSSTANNIYAPAADSCSHYDPLTQAIATGSTGWYLPAAGEVSLWFAQRVTINRTMALLKSDWTNKPDSIKIDIPFDENDSIDKGYWTSSNNKNQTVFVKQNGQFSLINKTSSGANRKNVRAVFSYHSSVSQMNVGCKAGDLISFKDGSKGVICYVDPNNPYKGWAAALHDLNNSDMKPDSGRYMLQDNTVTQSLTNFIVPWPDDGGKDLEPNYYTGFGKTELNVPHGMDNTKFLLAHNSRAATALKNSTQYNLDDGWYIPDMMQLRLWYALFPVIKNTVENNGGKLPNFEGGDNNGYWSSTGTKKANDFGRMQFPDGKFRSNRGTNPDNLHHVRPVRDFDLTVSWDDDTVASANPLADTMKVRPDTTQTYYATVKFCGWTLRDSATVTVATKPVIEAKNGTDVRDLGCNPATIPTMTVDSFTVVDNSKPDAKVTLTRRDTSGIERSLTWTATYQNQCGQNADTVRVTYRWCELSVKAKDSTKVFDGEALPATFVCTPSGTTPTVRYKVKNGDTWSDYTTDIPSITHAGSLTYLVEVISDNCNCTVSDTATLTITPKLVTVTAKSEEFTYDGTAHSNSGYDVVGLVGNDAITAVVSGSITFPSESPVTNELTSYQFTTGSPDNYSVTTANGELTMVNASRAITITAASQEWTYDGHAHTNNAVTVTEGTLFEGDMLVATATGSATNVADTEEGNNPIAEGYKIMHGEEDVTDNYEITAEAGTLTINPKAVTVTAEDKAFTYTGEAQSWPEYVVNGLIGNDAINAVVTGSITFPSESPVTNKLTSYEFTTGTPGNYNVTTNDGELTMSNAAVAITITAASDEKTYDGSALTNTTVAVTSGSLLTGDELVATATGSVTNVNVADVATGNNPIAEGYKVMHGEEDVTASYVITPVDGTLTINPQEVTVSVEDKTVEYNGSEQSGNTEYTFSNVVSGQTATITYTPAKGTLVDTYDNGTYTASSFKVVDASNNNMTANYTLGTQTPGKLTITDRTEKYEITVVAKSSMGNVYDGTEKSATGFETLSFTVDNKTYTVEGLTTSDPSSTNVCNLTNEVSGTAVVKDAAGNNVTNQFEVHTTDGTLEITTREVTVSVEDKTVEYNGSEQQGNTTCTFANVVDGHTATITYTSSHGMLASTTAYDNGSYDTDFNVVDASGNDVTANYTLGTQTKGKLTINNRTNKYEITVVANSNTGNVYDGQPHSATGFETLSFTVDGNTYTVEDLTTSNPSSTDVINIANAISGTAVVKDAAGNDVTAQFNIHTTNGTLEITAREVTVSVTDKTVEYNGSEQYGESAYAFANVVEGQTATITYTPAKGTLVNTYDNGSYTASTFKVMNGSTDVTTNYTLGTQTPGKLTITDRTNKYPITVVANSNTGNVYDGTAKSATGFETLEFTVEGNTYTVEGLTTSNPSSTDVINIANAISGTAVVKDAAGNDVTAQFTVHTTNGTLEITAREVTVSVADKTIEYNGSEQSGNTTYSFDNMVSGHTATITYTPSHGTLASSTAYNNGSYGTDFNVVDGEGADVTTNYTLGTQTPGKLTITDRTEPYAITVKANSSTGNVYDGQPHNATGFETLEFTVEGNTYTVSGLTTSDPSSTNVTNTANAISGTAVVKDAAGNNVTAQFDVHTTDGTLEITTREVTVSVEDKTVEYNGSEQSGNSEYTFDNVVSGQTATITYTPAKGKLVDTYDNGSYNTDFNVVDDNNNDVTTNYTLGTQTSGKLTIKNRTEKYEITVVAKSSTDNVYDGTAKSATGFETLSFTVDGNTYTVEGLTTSDPSSTNVCELSNAISGTAVVKDAAGNNVTAQFTVHTTNGKLKITPKAVTITAKSEEFTYDGTAHSNSGYDTVGLVGNDKISAVVTGSITFPGDTVTNVVASYEFTTGNAGNYNVTTTNGQLTMKKASVSITITAASDEWTYDGSDHANSTVTVTSGSLLTGDELVATATGSVTNVAQTATGNNPIAEGYKVMHGNEDVTANYTITPEAGTLTINPKAVTVTAQDKAFAYTGTALSWPEYDVNGLLGSDAISAVVTGSITFPSESPVTNMLMSYEFTAGTPENYSVTTANGQLTMTNAKREITITAASQAWTYDGAPHSNNTVTVTSGSLLPGNSLVATATGSVTNVADNATGNNLIVPGYKVMHDDEDVTANYAITTKSGTLTINPKPVTVTAKSEEFTYDGTAHSNSGYDTVGLVGNDKITAVVTGSITFPSQSPVTNTLASYEFTPGSTPGNYTVTTANGQLTMKKAEVAITITAASDEWTYDGSTHTNSAVTVTSGELLTGDELVATATGSVIKVADTEEGNNPIATGYKIMHGTEDVTANYAITTQAGTLTINPKAVTITAKSQEFTYDGTTHSNSGYDVEGLEGNDAITATVTGSITFPSESPVTNTLTSYEFTAGTPGNYTVDTVNGQLTMKKAEVAITITAASQAWIYDGNAHADSAVTVTIGSLLTGDSLVAKAMGSVTNVAQTATGNNPIAEGYKVMHGEEDVTENYAITPAAGTLTITERTVTVNVADSTTEYNGSEQYGNTEYTFDNVVSGQTATITYTPAKGTLASSTPYDNGAYTDFKVVDASNQDVTANYTLETQTKGKLTITDRTEKYEITVVANSSIGNVYDGTAKSVTGFETLSFTIEGNSYTVEGLTTSNPSSTNVCNLTNAITGTAVVKDAAGNDVTAQFTVHTTNGQLKISAREVTVSVEDKTVEYNGSEQYGNTAYSFSNVVSGQTATITYTPAKGTLASSTPYDNGTYTGNTFKVVDASSNNVTSNYTLGTQTPGKLTITDRTNKYEITVVANSNTGNVYDGTTKSATGFETLEFTVDGNTYTVSGLETSDPSSTNICNLTNAISGTAVVKDANNNNVTAQFNVHTTDGTLEILAREVTVSVADKTVEYNGSEQYGESAYTFANVVSGHTATITYTPAKGTLVDTYDNGTYTGNTFKVMDDSSNDVTSNYTLGTKTPGKLTIKNRTNKYEISVVAISNTGNVYDGTAKSATGFETLEFTVEDNTYTVEGLTTSDPSSTNVTNTANAISGTAVVRDANNNDVTTQFDVHTTDGTLEILAREVTVSVANDTTEYNGSEQYGNTTYSFNNVLSGQTATITYTPSHGTLVNTFDNGAYTANSFKVEDGDGTDVTSNYTLGTQTPGKLTIKNRTNKYEITVVANSNTGNVYDGTAKSATGFETLSFTVDGHNYTVEGLTTSDPSSANVCELTNAISGTALVKDAAGNDVTNQFVVSTTDGSLIITQKPVKVTARSKAFAYTGTAQSWPEYEVNGLVGNDALTAVVTGSITFPSQSPVTNELTSYQFTSGTPGNYTVTTANGQLTMTHASVPITITAASQSWTYDGNAHADSAVTVMIGSLLTGDSLVAKAMGSVTNVAQTANPIAAGYKVMHGEEDVTANYVITPKAGTLAITARVVTVSVADKEVEYNGSIQGGNTAYTFDNVVESQTATITYAPSHGTVVNTYDNGNYTSNSFKVVDTSNNDVTANYTLETQTAGKLTINDRTDKYEITVVANSNTGNIYDGTTKSATGFVTLNFNVAGHNYTVSGLTTSDPSSANVCELTNAISGTAVVKDVAGNDVTSQFVVNTTNGTLKITPRTVTVSVADKTVEYNGGLQYGNTACLFNNVASGQTATIGYTPASGILVSATTYNNGSYDNNFKVMSGNTDVTSNYILSEKVKGNLTINNRTNKYTINVMAKSSTDNVYDGTEKSVSGFETLEFHIGGNIFTVSGLTTSDPSSTNVCDLTNAISGTAVVTDAQGNDVTAQFNVVKWNGALKVLKRPITVSVDNRVVDYNGNMQYGNNVCTFSNVVSGQTATISYTTSSGITASETPYNNGSYSNDFKVMSDETDVTSNYTLTLQIKGTLKINLPPLTVKADTLIMEYDGTPLEATWSYSPFSANPTFLYKTKHSDGQWDDEYTSTIPNITDAGTLTYLVQATANNYSVEDTATLTVTPVAITIKANSATKVYGDSDPTLTAEVIDMPANGVEPVYQLSRATGEDVGNYAITVTAEAASNSNYIVSVVGNNFTITQRPITVSVADAPDVEYDGDEHTGITTYTFDDVLTGHSATITYTPAKGTLVGSYTGSYGDDFKVMSGSTDVTANYHLTTRTPGTLKVIDRETPYEITVVANSDTDIYDGAPHPVSGFETLTFTVSGNTYHVSGLSASVSATNAGSYLNVITGTAIVKDAHGHDVTSQFTVNKTNGLLKINPRLITLISDGGQKMYDGTPLTRNEPSHITVSGDDFVSGEGATYHITGSQTFVGSSDNVFTYTLNSNTLASNYKVDTVYGQLTVTSDTFAISIISLPYEWYFDGELHKHENYRVVYNAIPLDTVPGTHGLSFILPADTLTITPDFGGITHVNQNAEHNNRFFYTLLHDDQYIGKRDTLYGTLKILPVLASVHIKGNKGSATYNGDPHTVTGYIVQGIDEEHDLYQLSYFECLGDTIATRTETGVTPMNLDASDFRNLNTDFNPVHFYVTDGEMEVSPVGTVTVLIDGEDNITHYDGNEHSVHGYTVTSISDSLYTTDDFTFTGTAVAARTDVGTSYMGLADTMFHNTNPNFQNVIFRVEDGYQSIERIHVTVKIKGNYGANEYDGTYHSASGYNLNISDTLYKPSYISFSGNSVVSRKDKGTTYMELDTTQFVNQNANFHVTFEVEEDGFQKIYPNTSSLTLTCGSASKLYDGTPLTKLATATSTIAGDEFLIEYSTDGNVWTTTPPSITNYGDLPVEVRCSNPNYQTQTCSYSLSIHKREVTLTSADSTRMYNGDTLRNNLVLVGGDGFAAGEGATYNVTGNQLLVGSSDNTFTFTLNANTLAENYEIDHYFGTLTVTNRGADRYPITVTSNSNPVVATNPIVYDGLKHTASDFLTLSFTTSDGHPYTVEGLEAHVSAFDAGEYENTIVGTPVVLDEHGNDVTAQFDIRCDTGKLVIAKRPITITVPEGLSTMMYNGDSLRVDFQDIEIETLAARDALTAGYIITEGYTVGTYDCNEGSFMAGPEGVASQHGFTITHGDSEGEYEAGSSLGNYIPKFLVTLSITDRPLELTASSAEKVYDGTTLTMTETDFTVTNGTSIPTTDTVIITRSGAQTCVGETAHEINSVQVIHKADNVDVTSNYAISTVNGLLKVTPATTGLSCPPTLKITLKEGSGDTLVPASQLGTATHDLVDAGVATVSNDLSNNPLSVGTYNVTWTLYDACDSAMTTCEQTVVVDYAPCNGVTYKGHPYGAKRIGHQCWLTENLLNETDVEDEAIADFHAYKENPDNYDKFGYLYSWYSAVGVPEGDDTAPLQTSTGDDGQPFVQGICPTGWAVPSLDDYTELVSFVGDVALLKTATDGYWLPGMGGTLPNYEFEARAGGRYNSALNRYEDLMTSYCAWTSDFASGINIATGVNITYYCDSSFAVQANKADRRSVRCIRKNA